MVLPILSLFFFLLLTGGTTVHFEENPVKENAKAYDSNETEKPNIYTPLKGNTFYQYFFHGVTNDCLNVLKWPPFSSLGGVFELKSEWMKKGFFFQKKKIQCVLLPEPK